MEPWLTAAIAAASAVSASVLTGLVGWVTTRSQLKSQEARLTRELRHHSLESATARQVEARRCWLEPLSNAIATLAELHAEASQSLGVLSTFLQGGNKEAAESRRAETRDLTVKQAAASLEVLKGRYRGTDPELEHLLRESEERLGQYSEGFMAAMTKSLEALESDSLDMVEEADRLLTTARHDLIDSIMPVQRRIEELMAGRDLIP